MNSEYMDEMRRLSTLLDDALAFLRRQCVEFAEADDAYRMVKATVYLASSGTVAERQSHVDLASSDQRKRAHLAEGMKQAGLEAVRSRRAQISALQSLLSAEREETSLARTGPEMMP